jgi:hypothetical protein
MTTTQIRETVRQMLTDWDAATEDQRQAALALAASAAADL